MRFPGADMEPARNFPRPGTTAAQLLAAGSADFVWAGPDGSEVLTHWMAHGYGHGDMLASGGLSRALGLPASWPDRRPAHVDARIDGYLSDLRAVARTPYRLLAIGFDFVRPVPRLVELLDGWNDRHHGRTGTWLVNAAVDDYLDLVSHHRSSLPRLQLDPNPYWMGFYASRPDIKADARRLGRRLVAADGRRARWTLAGHDVPAPTRAHRAAWWTATTSNHHDFVTGTAPDRVARGEQARWLRQALDATADPTPDPVPAPPRDRPGPSLAVDRTDGRVVVTAPWGRATFAPERGGCLVGLRDADGVEHLSGPSLELHSYRESGGLWRMGHEINGGRWAPADRSSRHRATVEVTGDGHRIEVTATTTLDGRPATVVTTLTADDPTVVVRTAVTAPLRRTVTLALRQGHRPTAVAMHQPGGVVDRPLQRWYAPTFWPLHSFAGLVGPGHRDGPPGDLVVATASPTGIHVAPDGRVEVIVARTAVKEIAFGAVPVLAPAWGRAWGTQSAVIAAGWTPTEGRAAVVATGRALAGAADRAVGQDLPPGPVRSGDAQVEVISVKPADRGAGTIVRLRNWAPSSTPRPVPLRLDPDLGRVVTGAHLVDSRERDGDELPLTGGDLVVPVTRYLTSIRLVTGPGAAT